MASLPVSVVLALAAAHAPKVAPETVVAFAKYESALDPLAIHDNAADKTFNPGSLNCAIRLANELLKNGHPLDIGLMQIAVPQNLARFHLTVSSAFDPVKSIEAGAHVMVEAYQRCVKTLRGESALKCMASFYNTGSPVNGIANGYQARVWHIADYLVPAIRDARQLHPPLPDAPPPPIEDGDFHDAVAVHTPRSPELKDHD